MQRSGSRAAILFLVIIFTAGISSVSAIETELPVEDRVIRTDSVTGFTGLSVKGKRYAVPYILENAAVSGDRNFRKAVMDALKDQPDPLLSGYLTAAEVIFQDASGLRTAQELKKKALAEQNPEKKALLFFLSGVYSAASAEKNSNLKESCRIPELASSCRLAEVSEFIFKKTQSQVLKKDDYQGILNVLKNYISGNDTAPPFFPAAGASAARNLYSLGMPLEAAILAERMTYRDPSPEAAELRSAVPFFLAAAGDFRSAIRYSDRFSGGSDALYLNTKIDWMILGGMYREAIEALTSGSSLLLSPSLQNRIDYWTGFRHSPGSSSLKAAMLFYLAGDLKQAASLLEKLRDIPGANDEGEPYSLYAQLRLAQILSAENPELAHRIAEDVVYAAQAKGWENLEFQATVLDAWILYFQGKNYPAYINLVKAPGILRNKKNEPGWDYSHKLALLAVQNRLRPKGDQSVLIQSVSRMLLDKPYHEALFTAKHWLPSGVNRDFFAAQALLNFSNTGRPWEGMAFITSLQEENRLFFPPGENPGYHKGLYTSLHWIPELQSSETHAFFTRELKLTPPTGAVMRSASAVYGTDTTGIRGRFLRKGSYYVFSFLLNGERYVSLVYPKVVSVRRKTSVLAAIRTVRLSEKNFRTLAEKCRANQPQIREAECRTAAEELKPLRALMSSRKSFVIHTPYDPVSDINWGAALSSSGSFHDTVYFTKNIKFKNEKSLPFPQTEPASSCKIPGKGVIKIWPDGLDSADGKYGPRPIYLRHFRCDDSQIRFWDLDRFSADGPAAVVYTARKNETRLDAAFAEHFSSRNQGTILAEFSKRWTEDQMNYFMERLKAEWSHGVSRAFMRAAFQTNQKFPEIRIRIILPGFAE